MAYTARVLVIANVTASSPDLLEALKHRAESGPIEVTLLMPATEHGLAGKEAAGPKLDAVLSAWRAAGIEAEGTVGDSDPVEAIHEIWEPGRYDEVVVSTLPGATSKWLTFDFPHRVARITDASVTHVIARPEGWDEHHHREAKQEKSPLGPLSVLSWGGRKA